MPSLILLGTSNAIADPDHENTHMAVVGENNIVLIDCVGSPKVRLEQAGIQLSSITDLILTHFHPDHVSGVPLLLMNMWLGGRELPLRVYGLHHCLERIEDVMALYHWDKWPEFFPVAFHRLPEREFIKIIETEEIRIFSSPVRHLIPTIGLRIESMTTGRSVAYSCDTEPCPSVVRLATGTDVLIHEATGAGAGHSSASQAGSVARESGTRQLLLIHYPNESISLDTLMQQASETFDGEIVLAEDFLVIDL
ncbi:MAG: MBL fold metallo-hydrolase [Anaerolineales bacterium]|nr:MBL fold metallo-hydrolase [Anaerolineales bacterium]